MKKKIQRKKQTVFKENKDISTRTPPRITRCSGRLSTSWSTSCNCYVVNCRYTIGDATIMKERTGSWLQQLEQHMVAPINIRRKKRKTIILAIGTIGHIAFFWAVPLYQEHHDRIRKLWNNISTRGCVINLQALLGCFYIKMESPQLGGLNHPVWHNNISFCGDHHGQISVHNAP